MPTATVTAPEKTSAVELQYLLTSGDQTRKALISLCVGTLLTAVAIALGCFLAEVTVIGGFEQSRVQQVEYDHLRDELANSIAPISGYDYNGNPLPLGAPVALLDIPEIGVNEVVDQGTTSTVLDAGPGHLRNTPMPGQPGISEIMGREATYGGPFQYINQLTPGERFTVTTGQGVLTYSVLDVRYAGSKEQVPVTGQSYLVMVTATGAAFMPSDLVWVDAQLIDPKPVPNPGGAAPAMLPSEQVLASDGSAGTDIFWWTELLVAAVAGAFVLYRKWGRLQTWVVAVPVLGYLGLTLADQIARLLPNLF